ncbi:aminopeptidase N-like [Uranotaenia lowii]|uniref:aminopeptidase N-like n=1 Tax=Uranotaenia lowii TaxID=190385 RepID=UPI00247A1192|nr:aminopeptidase N-like [Uranotaenia lowii]
MTHMTCGETEETLEHVVFYCPRFEEERVNIFAACGPNTTADNMLQKMCDDTSTGDGLVRIIAALQNSSKSINSMSCLNSNSSQLAVMGVLKFLLLLGCVSVVFARRNHPIRRNEYSLPDRLTFDDREDVEEFKEDLVQRNPLEAPYRLPEDVVPYHYWVSIQTRVHQRGNRQFSGKVDLYFNVLNETNTVIVHNRGLTLYKVELYEIPIDGTKDDATITYPEYYLDRDKEFVVVSSNDTLTLDHYYILCIEYAGTMRTDEDGFYVSTYFDDDNTRRYLGVTQFQPISARSAFPCFDEPALKVTIDLEIIHGAEYSAVSNMPVEETVDYEEEPGFSVTRFETTPPISSYLLAFLVSDFEYLEEENQRVFARPNAVQHAQFALTTGLATIEALDEYYGVQYSQYMPKLDQSAIPDFSAGAMENWGLCTYREVYLLDDPSVTSYRYRTWIATIIAHEYAHQWFGNLVTNEWWSYLWLNEGFATLYEYYGANLAAPRMEYWELFNLEQVQWALYADSRISTRPMSYSRGARAPEIDSLFDNVAYSKGGSILNMFRGVLGDEAWADTIRTYLMENELQPVNPGDLVAAMESATEGWGLLPDGVSMGDFVSSWVDQAGYPVLEVRRNYARGEIILSQDRFYNDRILSNDQSLWILPYNLVNQSFADFNDLTWEWLTDEAVRLTTNVQADRWIIANKRQVGFYRVNYDVQNWYLIISALVNNWASVHRLNRAQLLDDAFHLAQANRLDLEVLLDLMVYLRNEMEYPPWTAASPIFSFMYNRLRGSASEGNFNRFVDSLTENVYNTLSIDTVGADETNLHKYLKQTISTWACTVRNENCLDRTRALLEDTIQQGESVHPDIAAVTYCFGLKNSSVNAFIGVFEKMKASTNLQERNMLLDSLGCTEVSEFATAYLYTAIGTSADFNYNLGERRRVLNAVAAGSRVGVDALIDFLISVYDYVIAYLGRPTFYNQILNIASRTNNEEELERLEYLLETLNSQIPADIAQSARRAAAANLAWHSSRDGLTIASFLEYYHPEVETTTMTSTTAGA